MTLFVREYSWMWDQLKLSLAECRVYAYIYGLSHGEKGGYDGSKRGLAKALGLSEACVRDTLNALKEKSLISYTNGLWLSESRSAEDNAHSVRTNDAQSVRESANSVRESAQPVRSPHTPLYNNIKDKKTSDMKTDFEKFFDKFSAEYRNRFAATQLLWDHRSKAAQEAMWNEVKDEQDFMVDKNPYFFVQNFREPTPDWKTGGETDLDLVQVRYGDRYKICTRATMELFGLEYVRDWN